MANWSVSKWFHLEKQKLAGMVWKCRLEYLWDYYRFHALAVIGALVLLGLFVKTQIYAHQEVLISGAFLNTDTSEAGYAHLREDYWEVCGGDEAKRADLVETRMVDYSKEGLIHSNSNDVIAIDAMIASQALDYLILDESALSYYSATEVCMDLKAFLPNALLERMEDRLVYCHGADSQQDYCAAIDLTGLAFEKQYGLTASPSYLIIPANISNPERVIAFMNYFFQ